MSKSRRHRYSPSRGQKTSSRSSNSRSSNPFSRMSTSNSERVAELKEASASRSTTPIPRRIKGNVADKVRNADQVKGVPTKNSMDEILGKGLSGKQPVRPGDMRTSKGTMQGQANGEKPGANTAAGVFGDLMSLGSSMGEVIDETASNGAAGKGLAGAGGIAAISSALISTGDADHANREADGSYANGNTAAGDLWSQSSEDSTEQTNWAASAAGLGLLGVLTGGAAAVGLAAGALLFGMVSAMAGDSAKENSEDATNADQGQTEDETQQQSEEEDSSTKSEEEKKKEEEEKKKEAEKKKKEEAEKEAAEKKAEEAEEEKKKKKGCWNPLTDSPGKGEAAGSGNHDIKGMSKPIERNPLLDLFFPSGRTHLSYTKAGGGHSDPVEHSRRKNHRANGSDQYRRVSSQNSAGGSGSKSPMINPSRNPLNRDTPSLSGRAPGGHDDGRSGRKKPTTTSAKNIEEILMWANHDPYKQPSGLQDLNLGAAMLQSIRQKKAG